MGSGVCELHIMGGLCAGWTQSTAGAVLEPWIITIPYLWALICALAKGAEHPVVIKAGHAVLCSRGQIHRGTLWRAPQ